MVKHIVLIKFRLLRLIKSKTKIIFSLYENRLRFIIILHCFILQSFELKDGIIDSINTCFNNFKSKTYKSILDNIIKPDFIRMGDEFQELLQYLIITNEYS